jgi:hypothetical protein
MLQVLCGVVEKCQSPRRGQETSLRYEARATPPRPTYSVRAHYRTDPEPNNADDRSSALGFDTPRPFEHEYTR